MNRPDFIPTGFYWKFTEGPVLFYWEERADGRYDLWYSYFVMPPESLSAPPSKKEGQG